MLKEHDQEFKVSDLSLIWDLGMCWKSSDFVVKLLLMSSCLTAQGILSPELFWVAHLVGDQLHTKLGVMMLCLISVGLRQLSLFT